MLEYSKNNRDYVEIETQSIDDNFITYYKNIKETLYYQQASYIYEDEENIALFDDVLDDDYTSTIQNDGIFTTFFKNIKKIFTF
jgi:hypothetical protein